MLAATQAGINSFLAFTKVLAEAPWPVNAIAAASTLVTGLAAQAKIWSTSIPTTAETGARFMVPDNGAGRVDGTLMRVNPGERVDVTPRGMSGDGDVTQHIFKVDSQTIFDVVNRGLRSGEIHEYSPAWNIA